MSQTPHGKVLGGSSAINSLVYIRGHMADYDSWEKLGCTGWGWREVEKYFKKLENYFINDGEKLPINRNISMLDYNLSQLLFP